MTDIELLQQINNKLDKLIAVISIQGKNEDDQMAILKRQGLTYKEIGDILGIPEGTIKSFFHRNKRK